MKNIELTEEHKSKLLEMCKKLFSDYDFTLDKWEQCFVTSGLKCKVTYDSHIHWFEFCTNEIVNELAWRNIKTDILADCEYEDFRMKLITKIFKDKFVGNNFHIVDYLYKQFKKLK